MGSITYGDLTAVFDDRTLTHLQIVMVRKLRRGDSFLMSWRDGVGVGFGRNAIWLHPQILLRFRFDGSRVPAINAQWLKVLGDSAESSRGLIVTGEFDPAPEPVHVPKPAHVSESTPMPRDSADV